MFIQGFIKTAGEPVAFRAIGKKLLEGAREAGGHTIKDTLKLKGLKHLSDAAKEHGGISNLFTTQKGRESLAKGVGSAGPSMGMAGLYALGGKKVYDKLNNQTSDNYYY